MTQTLSELIENAYKIKVALFLSSYQLYQYEDGSYVDFKVSRIDDPKLILKLAGGLGVKFLADDAYIIIRLFERYEP